MVQPAKSTTSKVKDLAPKSADTKAAKGGGVGPCWRTRK